MIKWNVIALTWLCILAYVHLVGETFIFNEKLFTSVFFLYFTYCNCTVLQCCNINVSFLPFCCGCQMLSENVMRYNYQPVYFSLAPCVCVCVSGGGGTCMCIVTCLCVCFKSFICSRAPTSTICSPSEWNLRCSAEFAQYQRNAFKCHVMLSSLWALINPCKWAYLPSLSHGERGGITERQRQSSGQSELNLRFAHEWACHLCLPGGARVRLR